MKFGSHKEFSIGSLIHYTVDVYEQALAKLSFLKL